MKTIRNNVFETNSSSTHSVSVFYAEDYEKFRNGELLYNPESDELITLEEGVEILLNNLSEESKIKILNDKLTYSEIVDLYIDELEDTYIEVPKFYKELIDSYYNDLETDITEFNTKSGENLIIMCRYGDNY